jgi:uncharacterized protein (DUF2236 family)
MGARNVDRVDTDLGYFGPESVTWRLHGEPLTILGGLRALLLQALHPDAMALLAERSHYQSDSWSRLQRTTAYVATLTFGTTTQVDEATARVRAVHARLGIDDPEQLAWVHVCEVDSFLAAAHGVGLKLSRADADRYVDEQARAAAFLLVPDSLIPRSTAALAQFIAEIRPRLARTDAAVEAARSVLSVRLPVPPRYTLAARLGWSTASAVSVGLLPAWARRMYRLPPLPGAGIVTTGTMRSLRLVVDALPTRWSHGPIYHQAMARAALAS